MCRARALALALDCKSARLIASNRRLPDAFSIGVLLWPGPDPAVYRSDSNDPNLQGVRLLHARVRRRAALISLPILDAFPLVRSPLLARPESGRHPGAASCESRTHRFRCHHSIVPIELAPHHDTWEAARHAN